MSLASEMKIKAASAPKIETRKAPAETVLPQEIVDQVKDEIPWMRRIEAVKEEVSEPRDLFDNSSVWRVDAPPEIRARVRFNWLSEWIIQHKPLMPGFIHEAWRPVTPDVMEDFQVKVYTQTRTKEGIPKIGLDAVLYWCPEEYAKQMDEFAHRGANIAEQLKTEKRRMKDRMEGMMIGNVASGTEEEIARMEMDERKELGTPLAAAE